jgi:uncharacterized protein (TIGR00369 family)
MSDLQNHPLIQKYIEYNQFGLLLGMNFSILSSGMVSYQLQIEAKHLATPIAAHGGAIAGLMDAALGVAALSLVCEQQKVVSTLEMNTRFHHPAYERDVLTATTNVLSAGNRILVVEAKIVNQQQQLIASGSGTFNAYPMEKAGFKKNPC